MDIDIGAAVGEVIQLFIDNPILSSPLTFAGLITFAVAMVWLALAPSRSAEEEGGRLEGYLQGRDIVEDVDMQRSFWARAVVPIARKTLTTLGRFTPQRDVESLRKLLVYAGNPGDLSVADILGLQILTALLPVGLYALVLRLLGRLTATPPLIFGRNVLLLMVAGFVAPRVWLRLRANQRKRAIIRTFSDALDLLSVSVDAGLGFDQALAQVSEQWNNALTEEFRRVLVEMRVGTPRDVALQRMSERTGVQDLQTFVGVLIQSSQLGVSIAETLHSQAASVRLRRRQRAEELAQQASIKMVFALVFFVFPALLIVLLGPGVPRIFEALGGL